MALRFFLSPYIWLPTVTMWLLSLSAQAQTDSTATQAPDSTAMNSGGGFTPPAAGLPAAEFETYNVDGHGVRYTAALTGLLTTGTVERAYFNTNHTGNLAVGHWQFPVALSFSYGRQSGQLKEREVLLLSTPAYHLGRWKLYALGEFATSNLRAIDHRTVLGGGVGYQLYASTSGNEVALSTFLLYENTNYLTEPLLQRRLARNSTRLRLRLNRGLLSVSSLLYYQPAVAQPATDYRLNNATVLAIKLYQQLALNLAYTYSFESVVVQSLSRANSTLSIGFAYSSGK